MALPVRSDLRARGLLVCHYLPRFDAVAEELIDRLLEYGILAIHDHKVLKVHEVLLDSLLVEEVPSHVSIGSFKPRY
jgi:hypothetical protein